MSARTLGPPERCRPRGQRRRRSRGGWWRQRPIAHATDKAADLDIARAMATAGIPSSSPIQLRTTTGHGTRPAGTTAAVIGYPRAAKPPRQTRAMWTHGSQGWRSALSLGSELDLIDLDPRNSGNAESLNGFMPTVYGVAATPSGGWHGLVKSMGVRSRDIVLPGIDVVVGPDPLVAVCVIDGCERPVLHRRLCPEHWESPQRELAD